jgi:hypothetical protein
VLLLHYSRAVFRILLPFIGIIVTCIVVATRQYTTYQLLDTNTYGTTIYSKTAGLEFAAYFIAFLTAILTGVICGLVINLFLNIKER